MRIPINPGAFADILPEGATLYKTTELPTVKYKKNGIEYEITDMTYLHPVGVNAFRLIMEKAANDAELKEVSFKVEESATEEDISIIVDIVMGFTYHARKKGRNGWGINGRYLVTGCEREEHNGNRVVTFKLDSEAVESLASIGRDFDITEAIEKYVTDINESVKGEE